MKTHTICNPCDGKGGFKINKDRWYDPDWSTCPVCDGFGFVDGSLEDRNIKESLDFDFFRKKITEAFRPYAPINMMTYDEFGKDVCIHMSSENGMRTDQFLRTLMYVEDNNPNVKCTFNRIYFYEDKRIYDFWKINISIKKIDDLESILETIAEYRKNGGGGLALAYSSVPYRGVKETT
ncbi:hypothetical protein [Pseudobutyrivibrio sp.]